MAEGKHRGKIVLAADPSSNEVSLGQTRTEIRGDATYVILGGGGLGGALIDWLLASGGVDERIDRHEPNKRLTVNLYETFKLPISGAVADFNIAPHNDGTELTLH
ncbi:MAG: hypothetical protein O7I93_09420, partial [Gemmatimonadetes bacterium]|nr:hypothetical protein [Gemmatimonadota bacterium]